MNNQTIMNTKQIYKNESSFSRMLKREGFTKQEIKELVSDDIITDDELNFYRTFTTKSLSYSTVSLRGGRQTA